VEADVHVCVKIARALGPENALLLSSIRREPSAHGRHGLSLVCVDPCVATLHFLAAAIFCYRSRTQRRSVYQYDDTRSYEWRTERK